MKILSKVASAMILSTGVLIPEISILLPMFIWIVASIYFYNKKINS